MLLNDILKQGFSTSSGTCVYLKEYI